MGADHREDAREFLVGSSYAMDKEARVDIIFKALPLGPFGVNVYIVGSQETKEAFIIDPGADSKRILKAVEDLGVTVKVIVNTHGHMDHTGAVATVKDATGASYAIHPNDIPIAKASLERGRMMVPDFVEPPEADILIRGGDLVQAGELTFTVLETPGHTPGGISLYGHGIVFTGDTLFQGSIGRFDSPDASGAQLLSSIYSKLLILPDDTIVLPGHGFSTTIGREKRSNPFLQGRGILGL